MKLKAQEVADLVDGVVDGDKESTITKLSKIESGDNKSLSFLGNPKYNEYIYKSKASIVIVNKDLELKGPVKPTLIRVDDPNIAFSLLLDHFNNQNISKIGIDPNSSIHNSVNYGENLFFGSFSVAQERVTLGDNVKIQSQVYIGENVKIGNNCIIYPGVIIYRNSVIGNNCIIHSGSVIGSDGFGFNFDSKGNTLKVVHNGNVVIEDDVEIGSNCSIDKATLGSTIIKSGAKLDNLVQIAHNVIIGKNTCLAAQVGVAGSTVIGDNCLIGGQVGIAGHLKIGDKVHIQAKSGVLKNIKSKSTVMGYPAINYMDYNKSYVHFKNLPKVMQFIYKLMKKDVK
ncbi:MAG: UDP-3-O-(3-hydroxymyristoyl)glucosamine N-acyltransferase [Flavobacteriaceae bacterium]|nr:UDP-3-O-(3-hydroxymyristoyl)glucosamine N-acyltransferase [Flavobacteriaceae bacterium]MBL6684736.1 UDP-3-O-(3-hydroxymyristoyl)glucosamine N-acyltransferase [Flavobacteriaceae bacterium]